SCSLRAIHGPPPTRLPPTGKPGSAPLPTRAHRHSRRGHPGRSRRPAPPRSLSAPAGTVVPVAGMLDDLNPNQRQAVTSCAAPLCILAGAGSGKTRVLTRRIAYRITTGAATAGHVLALTFTRKAAGEL